MTEAEATAINQEMEEEKPSSIVKQIGRHVSISSALECVPAWADGETAFGQGPTGEVIQIEGINVYISRPAGYPQTPSRLLLFLTGATGLHSLNNQIQADKFAAEGFLVLLPDQFPNDPLPGTATYVEEEDPSIIDKMKYRVAETAKSFLIDMWLARQTPEKVLPLIKKVIDGAYENFPDAISHGGGVYCVGYCFGGRMTLLLASEKLDMTMSSMWGQSIPDEETGRTKSGPYIKAGAIAHATLVAKEDFDGVKSPLAFVCVENDQLFADEVRKYGEELMKSLNVECEFHIHPNVPHGFGVVGEYTDAKIRRAQAVAFEQMIVWFKKH
ncbi:BgtA-20246 [Blumeria graminis f. sp. tritici]|uniref:BgtA-20246 n=2 Tax=Blumeria graminis f. sp. tritici TaxID=62690 RepID=A0A9X9PS38_BLUGR|nr:BgtA-20246 [Blumeria graminis f. sp. tritici]